MNIEWSYSADGTITGSIAAFRITIVRRGYVYHFKVFWQTDTSTPMSEECMLAQIGCFERESPDDGMAKTHAETWLIDRLGPMLARELEAGAQHERAAIRACCDKMRADATRRAANARANKSWTALEGYEREAIVCEILLSRIDERNKPKQDAPPPSPNKPKRNARSPR